MINDWFVQHSESSLGNSSTRDRGCRYAQWMCADWNNVTVHWTCVCWPYSNDIVAVISGRMTHGANSPLKAYVHQLAWLQYSSLALTAAAVLYSECDCSVDAEVTDSATQLYETNVQTTINYFTEHTDVDQQNTVDQHATADQHAIADQDTTADHPQLGLSLLFILFLNATYNMSVFCSHLLQPQHFCHPMHA